MKTIQQLKDEYAQGLEYEDFEDYIYHIADSEDGVKDWDIALTEIAKAYAKEAVRELAEQVLKDFPLDEHK